MLLKMAVTTGSGGASPDGAGRGHVASGAPQPRLRAVSLVTREQEQRTVTTTYCYLPSQSQSCQRTFP